MSLFDYRQSLQISATDPTFGALVMALLRKADDENVRRIDREWPDLAREMRARYNAPGGMLPHEAQPAIRPAIGIPVGKVTDGVASICLCTMDEAMDGHRHHCVDHLICGECLPDFLEEDDG